MGRAARGGGAPGGGWKPLSGPEGSDPRPAPTKRRGLLYRAMAGEDISSGEFLVAFTILGGPIIVFLAIGGWDWLIGPGLGWVIGFWIMAFVAKVLVWPFK